MNNPSKSESRRPIFVDEVDRLVEFHDSCIEDLAAWDARESAGGRKPDRTEVVDRLVEFVDTPVGRSAAEVAGEKRPLFVDTVDRVLEFTDLPVSNSAIQAVTDKNVNGTPPVGNALGEPKQGKAVS
jgi:hypothetical protein